MKKGKFLFRLIKSLNKGEKIHFRKLASNYVNEGKNNYLKLFDVLDQQEEYDENALKKSLKGKFLLKHLAESKYYLQQLLLKSLNSFHSSNSVDLQLRELLNTVEICYKKGLIDDIPQLLNKGKRIAKEYERSLKMVELLKWERILLSEKIYLIEFKESKKLLREETQRFMDMELMLHECTALQDIFIEFRIKQQKHFLGKKDLEDIKATFNGRLKEMQKMEKEDLSFDSRRILYNAYVFYYKLIGDNKALLVWSDKLVKLIESNLHQAKENPSVYLSCLYNHMGCLIANKRYEECLKVAKKIEAAPSQLKIERTEEVERRVFLTRNLEFLAYLGMGLFKEAIVAFGDQQPLEKRFKENIPRQMLLTRYYNLSWVHFLIGDLSNAIKWINEIVNNVQFEGTIISLLSCSRMLNLMIHFEKENYELLNSLSKSTLRYLSKQTDVYNVERIFINFIVKLSDAETGPKQTELFIDFRKQLIPMENNAKEQEVLSQLKLISWVESKLNGRTFEEEYLKKLKIKN